MCMRLSKFQTTWWKNKWIMAFFLNNVFVRPKLCFSKLLQSHFQTWPTYMVIFSQQVLDRLINEWMNYLCVPNNSLFVRNLAHMWSCIWRSGSLHIKRIGGRASELWPLVLKKTLSALICQEPYLWKNLEL